MTISYLDFVKIADPKSKISNRMWKMAKYEFVYIHVLKKALFMRLLKDCESAKS